MDANTKAKAVNLEDLQTGLQKISNKGIANVGTCSTAAGTAAKAVTLGTTFELVTGATLVVKFANDISVGSATLAVTHTTLYGTTTTESAKPIYYKGSALAANVIKAGSSVIMRYDGNYFEIIGDANGNYYSKNETYSKAEVNALITTPSQTFVNVTATAQTTDVTTLLPATGAADTVYRVGNWDGNQYTTSAYSEYAWNGNSYLFLDKKDTESLEGIIRLSGAKYNKTNGVTFTDKKRINYTSGTIGNNDSYSSTSNISVDGLDKIQVTIPVDDSGSSASGCAFYSETGSSNYISGERIRKKSSQEQTYEVRILDVPQGAKYFRTTWLLMSSADFGAFSIYGIVEGETTERVSELEEKVSEHDIDIHNMKEMSGEKNEISSLFSFTDGYRINYVNGKIQESNYYSASGFVDIEGLEKIYIKIINIPGNISANGLAFYTGTNEDTDFISGVALSKDDILDTYVLKFIDVPKNAKYIRTTWLKSDAEQYSQFSCDYFINGYLQKELDQVNIDLEKLKEEVYKGDTNVLPDYYFVDDYIDNRITAITTLIQNRNLNSDIFFWFTDPHSYNIPTLKPMNGLNTPLLINYIKERVNIRKVFCGGDLTGNGGGDEKADTINGLQLFRKYCDPIWENMNVIIGNHEWNNANGAQEYMDKMLPISLIYDMTIKDKEHEINGVDSLGDYYIDNPVQKIRYLFIGCEYNATISVARVKWVAEQLLSIPSSYTVVVLSHVGLTTGGNINSSFSQVTDVLDAAKAKTSITVDGQTYNYSSFGGHIACVICGHNHVDADNQTPGGIPVISTTCDRGPKSSSTDNFKAARKLGTINEQAIDVYLIDTSAKKINTIRIGGSFGTNDEPLANPDREFTY